MTSHSHPAVVESFENRRLLSLVAFGPDTQVPGGAATTSAVAVAGDGSYYVAAVVEKLSPSLHRTVNQLLVTRFASNGVVAGSTAVSNYITAGTKIDIAVSAEGGALVTYQETRGSKQVLSVSRVDGLSMQVDTGFSYASADTGTGNFGGGTIASSQTDGTFFLAWTQAYSQNNVTGTQLMAEHVVPSHGVYAPGNAFAVATPLATGFKGIGQIDLSEKRDGGSAVIAYETRSAGSLTTLNTAYALINPTTVTQRGSLSQLDSAPRVAMDADGTFVIGTLQIVGSVERAMAMRFSASGTALSTRVVTDSANSVDITALPDDRFVVIATTRAEDVHEAVVTQYKADSTTGESVTLQATVPGYAHIGSDSLGNLVATYLDSTHPAPTDTIGPVHVQRLTTFAAVQGNELYVVGSDGNDDILVEAGGSRYDINVAPHGALANHLPGTAYTSFPGTRVKSITVLGLGGDDVISNESSAPSQLSGGAGNDRLIGGEGADVLLGGAGVDTLYGNGGNDQLYGGSQGDYLSGGAGNDSLYGQGGYDRLLGDAGNDVLAGGTDPDVLFGGTGRDTAAQDDADTFNSIESQVLVVR